MVVVRSSIVLLALVVSCVTSSLIKFPENDGPTDICPDDHPCGVMTTDNIYLDNPNCRCSDDKYCVEEHRILPNATTNTIFKCVVV